MKRSVAIETEETEDSSTETESLLGHTPRRMSDPEIETSSSEAVTLEDVEHQIRAVTDLLIQQLAHLCELMKELWDAQTHRHHEKTFSSRTASTSAGSTSRSDNGPAQKKVALDIFETSTFFEHYLYRRKQFFSLVT